MTTAETTDTFETTPIPFTEEQLGRIAYNGDGLVGAIVQDASDGAVLMFAWMNAESLRRTLETGRTWFWSRSRQEFWCKGETSGDRQYVRAVHYDCDGDVVAGDRGPGRSRGVPHRQPHLLLPSLRPRTLPVSERPGRRHRQRAGGGRFPLAGRPPPDRPGLVRAGGRHPHAGGRLPADRGGRRPYRLPARVGRRWRALGPVLLRGAEPSGHHHGPGGLGHDPGGPRPRRGHRAPGQRGPGGAGRAGGRPGHLRLARPPRPPPAPRRTGRLPGLRRGPRGRAPARHPTGRSAAIPTPSWPSSGSWLRSTTGASAWC